MVPAVDGEQFAFFDRVVPVITGRVAGAFGRDVFLGGRGGTARGAGEPDEIAGAPIQDALEVTGDADRPRQRCRFESDPSGDFVEQRESITARPVPLVDHGDDRNAAVTAHLKELQGLRFKAFRRVDQHHGAINGAEHPVGVLGEVGVPGGVEQVDDAVLPLR